MAVRSNGVVLAGAIDMGEGDSMSAIPCASVSLKTMADGTLRISFDVEPMHAQDAFRLFAAPGTPAAIAALQVGYEQKADTSPEPVQKAAENELKGGALAMLAGQWCADPVFQKWLFVYSELEAAQKIKRFCEVDSRRMLDHNPKAADLFQGLFRTPYMKHLRGIELERETA